MDDERRQDQAKRTERRRGRTWTERLQGPVRYRHFTARDDGGRPSIFFKFEQQQDGSEVPREVYDILKDLKTIKRPVAEGGGESPTGLIFNRSKSHGRVWVLPDDFIGRTAAEIINARLGELAERLDHEPGRRC